MKDNNANINIVESTSTKGSAFLNNPSSSDEKDMNEAISVNTTNSN